MSNTLRTLGMSVLAITLLLLLFANIAHGQDPRERLRGALRRDLTNLAKQSQIHFRSTDYRFTGNAFLGLWADGESLRRIMPFNTFGNANGVYMIMTAGTETSVGLKGVTPLTGHDGRNIEIRMQVLPDSRVVNVVN